MRNLLLGLTGGLLIAGGFAIGIAIGLGLALLVERFQRPIRGSQALQSLLGVGPLVVIPTLKPRRPGKKKRKGRSLFRRRKVAPA